MPTIPAFPDPLKVAETFLSQEIGEKSTPDRTVVFPPVPPPPCQVPGWGEHSFLKCDKKVKEGQRLNILPWICRKKKENNSKKAIQKAGLPGVQMLAEEETQAGRLDSTILPTNPKPSCAQQRFPELQYSHL